VEVGNQILHTFHYFKLFQISTDFKLFKRFHIKAGLTRFSLDRLITTLISNPLEFGFGQEVLHGDLQYLN
jgi:hypothetical protein